MATAGGKGEIEIRGHHRLPSVSLAGVNSICDVGFEISVCASILVSTQIIVARNALAVMNLSTFCFIRPSIVVVSRSLESASISLSSSLLCLLFLATVLSARLENECLRSTFSSCFWGMCFEAVPVSRPDMFLHISILSTRSLSAAKGEGEKKSFSYFSR